MSDLFRMPDGTVTTSAHQYGTAWRELGAIVEELFPGYVIYGFDPGIMFYRMDNLSEPMLILSVSAIKSLEEGLRRRDERLGKK